MKLKDIKPNLKYKVIKGSECETFQANDIVGIWDDKRIWCKGPNGEGGWLEPEETLEFLDTVEVELIKPNLDKLKQKKEELEKLIQEYEK